MANIFNYVPNFKVKRTAYDLSYTKQGTFDMGQLIPIMCDEVVPGDVFKIGAEVVIRPQPLVAPAMIDCDVFLHYFFLPYRILWKNNNNSAGINPWELFITGGIDGPEYDYNLNQWIDKQSNIPSLPTVSGGNIAYRYSVGDYLGFPNVNVPSGSKSAPLAFPWYAYNMVYNECYRNENYQDPVALNNNIILNRNYTADYFTTALPWAQRGIAPRFPVTGVLDISWLANSNEIVAPVGLAPTANDALYGDLELPQFNVALGEQVDDAYDNIQVSFDNPMSSSDDTAAEDGMNKLYTKIQGNQLTNLLEGEVNLNGVSTFDINDVRFMSALQRWQELNARTGVRYVEFLQGHFNVSPSDARLQRPEFIGGIKTKLIVSEVLQTAPANAQSDRPLASLGGVGLVADNGYIGKYRAEEYGLILGLMSVVPKTSYAQGVNRQWLRKDRTDFYFPEFANLGEQEVYQGELYYTGSGTYGETADSNTGDFAVFGFQQRFSEMKHKQNIVCADFRDENSNFAHWHLARFFDEPQNLGNDFLQVKPEDTKRIFAVQDEKSLIFTVRNLIKAYRPIPKYAIPKID